MSNILS